MDWPYILARTYIQTLSQEAKDALQKYNVEAIQKFKTSKNLNETNLNIHKKNYHLPLMKKNFKNVRNSILTKIWSHLQMISWILSPVKNILMTTLIKVSSFIKHIMTEFRQTLQVQSHIEMPGILVQLGHIQRT